jgi:siderophore synthetase component
MSSLKEGGVLASYLSIVPEEIGLIHRNRGAIVRRLPRSPLVPAFSLSSPDLRDNNKEVLAATILRKAQESTGENVNHLFVRIFVTPTVESLFSAFCQGFSLEMHMQNVLFHFEDTGLVSKIYYRDLEGVVFSREFRESKGLPDLFYADSNPELHNYGALIYRFFNRNLDYDLARVFSNLIDALEKQALLRPHEKPLLIHSVRRSVRQAVRKYGLWKWAFWGRWLRFSRTPYGTSLRHRYYCRFR